MKDILQEIALKTKERVEAQKKEVPLEEMKAQAMALVKQKAQAAKEQKSTQAVEGHKDARMAAEHKELAEPVPGKPETYAFYRALSAPGIHLICEAKKASPSKGLIAEEFPYVDIAKDYEAGGASAISVLTEPFYFLGSNDYLKEIRTAVSIPVLRKDFTVDAYQIYEAKVLGAHAILLICAILEEETLCQYLELAHSLGLSALVETHNPEEIQMALRAGANIIGVNNRNLKDFSVDITHSADLRKLVPEHVVFVAESGIHSKEQIAELKKDGVNAVLIGETFMRADDRKAIVAEYAQI